MAKTRGGLVPPERSPERLNRIIEVLFPSHATSPWPSPAPQKASAAEVAAVTNEALLAVTRTLDTNKAPGPDEVPNLALKAAIMANPDMFRTAMQRCLDASMPRKFSPSVKIVGLADDITLEVYGESIVEVELTAAHAIAIVEEWMS